MKTPKLPAKEKPARVPRFSALQTHYSPGALLLMEKAIGQRITQLPTPTPPLQEPASE